MTCKCAGCTAKDPRYRTNHSGWRGQNYEHLNGCNCSSCWASATTTSLLAIRERIGPMSQSLWCNINDIETNQTYQIGHSFSEADEDREHYTKTRTVEVPTGNSYGRATYQERQEVSETIDVCGYHARKQAGLSNAPAITVTAEDIDVVEAEAADAAAEMWKARYEAEKARRKADI